MSKLSQKRRRQHTLRQLIQGKNLATQEELQKELEKMGVDATQSSLSRDLNELGVIKRGGFYQLMSSRQSGGILPPISALTWAGPNLLILKTHPSMAPSMGSLIDSENIPGIMGTVAGDDTVFVATGPAIDKNDLEHHIRTLFG